MVPRFLVSVQTVEGDHQTRVVDEELPPVTWLKKLETLNEHHHNLNETLKLTVKSDRVVQLSSLFSDYSIESSTFDSQNQIHFSLPQNQHISVRNHEHILLTIYVRLGKMARFDKIFYQEDDFVKSRHFCEGSIEMVEHSAIEIDASLSQ